jgi:hypothetical protein
MVNDALKIATNWWRGKQTQPTIRTSNMQTVINTLWVLSMLKRLKQGFRTSLSSTGIHLSLLWMLNFYHFFSFLLTMACEVSLLNLLSLTWLQIQFQALEILITLVLCEESPGWCHNKITWLSCEMRPCPGLNQRITLRSFQVFHRYQYWMFQIFINRGFDPVLFQGVITE